MHVFKEYQNKKTGEIVTNAKSGRNDLFEFYQPGKQEPFFTLPIKWIDGNPDWQEIKKENGPITNIIFNNLDAGIISKIEYNTLTDHVYRGMRKAVIEAYETEPKERPVSKGILYITEQYLKEAKENGIYFDLLKRCQHILQVLIDKGEMERKDFETKYHDYVGRAGEAKISNKVYNLNDELIKATTIINENKN